MKQTRTKKLLSMIMALLMIVTCLVSPAMAAPANVNGGLNKTANVTVTDPVTGETAEIQTSDFSSNLTADEEVTIMVRLEGETTFMQTSDLQLAAASYDSQMTAMAKAENRIASALGQSIEVQSRFSLLFNGFSFIGKAWMVDAINEIPGVTAFVAPMFELIEAEAVEDVNLSPNMASSTQLVGATAVWDMGYTGEGMVVAVLDTGISQTHDGFSANPENGKFDKAYLENVYKTYGDKMHGGSLEALDDIYYSDKMPFNWDYFDGDAIPNHTSSTHGSHVAGIVAGNNGKDFKGVAPDAQIVTMQVFNTSGGASFATLMEAMEDCVYLGVDAINMSLGITAYFTAYETISPDMEGLYDALENAGIAICAAAGNDADANYQTNISTGYGGSWFSWNVDAGTIGAPATFPGSFAVASVANGAGTGYFTAYGEAYYPSYIYGNTSIGSLEEKAYNIVYVGLGSPEEIEAAGGVEGKIALVKRGELDFAEKATNAADAGAVACLIFNNESSIINVGFTSTIPVGMMTKEAGEKLISKLTDGVLGTVTVNTGKNYKGVSMAITSSWGTTANLDIKPEIAAPGDNISSVIGYAWSNTSYGNMSGTSMATPHVAGGMLLVKQRLREVFPEKSAVEINQLAHSFLMSTAHQTASDVRRAGAGLIDLPSAVTTEAYLSVPGIDRPKLELRDNEEGEFAFTFEVNNFGKTEKTYKIVPSVLTENVTDLEYTGYGEHGANAEAFVEYNRKNDFLLSNPTATSVKLISGYVIDVTDQCDITAPRTVTVPAGETVAIEMTIKVGKELMAYIEENFPSGIYLEGYIALEDQTENGVDLSIPFLGFVGNWNYGPMFDQGFWWNLPYGVNNLAQMPTSWGTYLGYAMKGQGLGLNYYWDETGETYVADRNAISPNGDGWLDTVDHLEFALMRTPKIVKLYAQDAEGNVLKVFEDQPYAHRKEYYNPGNSPVAGTSYSSFRFDFIEDEMVENETVYLVLEAWLDREGFDINENQNGRIVFPITKDTIAPVVTAIDGGFSVKDTNYAAYYAVYANLERTELIAEDGIFAEKRNVATNVTVDLDTYFVSVADYAHNEAFYMVMDGKAYEVEADGFTYTGKNLLVRSYVNWDESAATGIVDFEYGWYTLNTDTPTTMVQKSDLIRIEGDPANNPYIPANTPDGADFVSGVIADDGTAYVNSLTTLYTLDLETYEVTEVAPFTMTDYDAPTVRCMTKNPETGEVYAWASISYANPGFCKINLETGELTLMWLLDPALGFWGKLFNQGACFIDGETVAIWSDNQGHMLWLAKLEDGIVYETLNIGLMTPGSEHIVATGTLDGGNSMIYDAEENKLYLFHQSFSYFFQRDNTGGFFSYDLDDGTVEVCTAGEGNGHYVFGMFFMEESEPETEPCVFYKEVVAPTCTTEGYTAHICVNCGYAYRDEFVPAYCPAGEFTDLNTSKWYHEGVCYAIRNGLMNGMSETIFAPESNMTRAQLVTVLYRLAGEPSVEGLENPFVDVAADLWYTDAVIWAYNAGVVNGISATTFAPNANITREQLVTILYRFYGEPAADTTVLAAYTDKDAISEYAVDAMAWAVENGIVNGMTATTLVSRGSATRAQIATILMRMD